MAVLDDILDILRGRKVLDEATNTWRVYDQSGNELADPGGVIWKGLHGLLLSSAICCCKVAITTSPSRAHKQEKYHSPSWSIDWQQPIIKEVEKVLPKEYVKLFKKNREEHKPSKYLLKLLEQLTLHIEYLDSELSELDNMERYVRKLDKLEKLKYKLEKTTKAQIKKETKQTKTDDIEFLLVAYNIYFK